MDVIPVRKAFWICLLSVSLVACNTASYKTSEPTIPDSASGSKASEQPESVELQKNETTKPVETKKSLETQKALLQKKTVSKKKILKAKQEEPVVEKKTVKKTIAVKTPKDYGVSSPSLTPSPIKAPEKALTVKLEDLPLLIERQWIINGNETACSLQSTERKIEDGQGTSLVTLKISASSLEIFTTSVVDLSYPETGITFDDGRHFPLESLIGETHLQFPTQSNAILAQMNSKASMVLALGFWPTWPVTETQTLAISLDYFPQAHEAWEICNALINSR